MFEFLMLGLGFFWMGCISCVIAWTIWTNL